MMQDRIALVVMALVCAATLFFIWRATQPKPPSLEKREDARPPGDLNDPDNWQLGPVIADTKPNGLPLRPSRDSDGWLYFDIRPGRVIGYVTARCQPLIGKQALRLTYEVDGEMTADPADGYPGPTMVTPYFAHKMNDWQSDGTRWWATFLTGNRNLVQAEILEAPFDANWTSVIALSAHSTPGAFEDGLRNAWRVGFTFRSATGFGHGATGAARFRWLFEIV